MIVGRTINYNRLRNPVAAHRTFDRATRLLRTNLFGNGEQGAMYVPKPQLLGQQVLYQDAAGTVPVTADGDPIGLGLEASRKLELGPELVDPSAWSIADSSFVVDGDTIEKIGSSVRLFVFTDQGVVGSLVEITIEFENLRDGTPVIVTNGQTVPDSPNFVMVGYSSSFTITTRQKVTGNKIGIYGAVAKWKILGVSVREIPGNHLIQSVSADRPLYRTDGTLHWAQHDQAGDALVTTLPDLGTNATLAYANESGVTILEGQTISGATTIPQEVELYGVIYLDRPFTASETTKVTDYFNKLRGAA